MTGRDDSADEAIDVEPVIRAGGEHAVGLFDELGRQLAEARAKNERLTAERDTWYRSAMELLDARCAELAEAHRKLDEARVHVGNLADPDPCRFDHNGGCQAHGWLDGDCGNQRAKQWLDSSRSAAPEATYRPCAGCDSVTDSCRQVGCPAVSAAPEAPTGRWRVGRSYGQHVYEQSPTTPDGDRWVASFPDPADAARAVAAVNAAAPVADDEPATCERTHLVPVDESLDAWNEPATCEHRQHEPHHYWCRRRQEQRLCPGPVSSAEPQEGGGSYDRR